MKSPEPSLLAKREAPICRGDKEVLWEPGCRLSQLGTAVVPAGPALVLPQQHSPER